VSFWACAQLAPNRTRLALHFLGLHGYEVYCPRVRVTRKLNPDGSTLLFPGYAFVAIELQWHTAHRSPGVMKLIMHDDRPARVPDRVIAALRKREHNGLIELPPPPRLRRGDPVHIVSGAFQGHAALYQGMRPRQRVEVLLALFASERRVELSRRDIVPAGVDGP
jgi:transcription antitermination factor NusG